MSKMKRKWIENEAVGSDQLDLDFPLATRCTTEPDDSQLDVGMVVLWFDEGGKKLGIKAKASDGRFYTGNIGLKRRK